MIKTLKKFFDDNLAEIDEQPSEHEQRLAAAALLFEISRSDFDVDELERKRIGELVAREFDLSEEETGELMQLAEQQAVDSTSLHEFTSLINEHWPLEQRVRLIEYMWRVAFADHELSEHELHLMRKVGRLLYIPHKQFIAAKIRARETR